MIQKSVFALLACTITFLSCSSQIYYKYDNNLYNAVYLNDAFRFMDTSKNYLLLDVRSPGEYSDTSRSTALNIGRIKGARNINIDDVPTHLNELKKYSDQPVFVYCSHSQRSRRVSKLLAENGFTKVYNINGGMSLVNEMDAKRFPYKEKVLEIHTSYKNIASTDAASLIKNNPDIAIIDIRTAAEFASKDTASQNNMGRFKNAINIPQDVFAAQFDSYKISSRRPVLLYDLNGYNSMDVVDVLQTRGFTRIYNLFEGLAAFACDHAVAKELRNQLLINTLACNLLDPEAAIDLLTNHPNTIVIDTRSVAEFENRSSVSYHNLGRIKGAINIATSEALQQFMQQHDKSTPLLVYGGMENMSGSKPCNELLKNGFTRINFLSQGIYRFVWATANIEDCKAGRSLLENHEGLY